MRLRFSASIELDDVSARVRFAAIAALVAAGLVALASLAGIAIPAIYAREAPVWRVQGIGQDWANLLVAVPWLVTTAVLTLRGSRRARLLLGAGLAYTTYSYAMYAFDVHFNALFLVYCGALGLASYALVALATELDDARDWIDPRAPHRLLGGIVMAVAAAFALLWLSQIVPALVTGTTPPDVAEAGLLTNPVHVLDLALVLPAMFAGGWLLWQRRRAGYVLVPIALGFTALMGAAVASMAIQLAAAAPTGSNAPAIGFAGFALVAAGLLAWMLRPIAASHRLHPAT